MIGQKFQHVRQHINHFKQHPYVGLDFLQKNGFTLISVKNSLERKFGIKNILLYCKNLDELADLTYQGNIWKSKQPQLKYSLLYEMVINKKENIALGVFYIAKRATDNPLKIVYEEYPFYVKGSVLYIRKQYGATSIFNDILKDLNLDKNHFHLQCYRFLQFTHLNETVDSYFDENSKPQYIETKINYYLKNRHENMDIKLSSIKQKIKNQEYQLIEKEIYDLEQKIKNQENKLEQLKELLR